MKTCYDTEDCAMRDCTLCSRYNDAPPEPHNLIPKNEANDEKPDKVDDSDLFE